MSSGISDRYLMFWTKAPRSRWRDEDFTLQRLSIKCILKHHNHFLKQAKDNNPFEKLSDKIKNAILALLVEKSSGIYGDYWTQMLQLLINKTTSKLELGFDPNEGNMLLASLVALQPQLKCLELKVDFPEEDEMDSDDLFDIPIPSHLFKAILSFVEMEDLDLHRAGCLNDKHLDMIAANLKKLKRLHLCLDFDQITMAGLKKLSKLKDLRQILISGNTQFDAADRKMRHNLLRVLPQLESVNNFEQIISRVNRHCDLDEECLSFSLLPKTQIQLGLKQLILYKTAAQIPPNITMQNLESLFLIRTRSFAPSSNFNKVTMLCLGFLGINTCNEILGHLGRQIQKLNIMEDKGTLYLDDIAQKCPILEEFYLPEGPPNLATNFKEMSFAHLKVFSYNECHDSQTSMAKFGPRALLRLVSGAPNLEFLALNHVEFIQMELDPLVRELQAMNLLQKLEIFSYDTLKLGGTEAQRNLILRIRKRYETLAEEMKLHCPCLKEISGTCY